MQKQKDNINKRITGLSFAVLLPLQMIQGGYFPNLYLPIGIALSLYFMLGVKDITIEKREVFCLVGLMTCYICSAVVHGGTKQVIVKVFYILNLMLLWLFFWRMREYQHEVLKGFLLTVILQEAVGTIAYIGVPLEGVICANRFMGTYQYANITAMVLIIAILITQNEMSKDMGQFLLLHYIFLLLTVSVGGMLVYLFVEIFLVCTDKANRQRRIYREVFTMFAAVLCAALLYIACFRIEARLLTGILILGCLSLSFRWETVCIKIESIVWLKNSILFISFIVMVTGISYLMIKRAGATFLERFWQMKDALWVIINNPLLGIGGGAWKQQQYLYQTHEYDVSLIHNSYLQIAVEAGLPALLFFLGLIGIVLWNGRKEQLWKKAILYGFLIHLMVDIDFFFLGYMAVIIACLTNPTSYYKTYNIKAGRIGFLIPAVAFFVIWCIYL